MEIRFNKNLYKRDALEGAIADYKGLALFDLREDENYFVVNLHDIDNEVVEKIEDEFANYVLVGMKN